MKPASIRRKAFFPSSRSLAITALGLSVLPAGTLPASEPEPVSPVIVLSSPQRTVEGNYTIRDDVRRNLILIDHPIQPSAKGDAALLRWEATIPATLKPPYRLEFYSSDNLFEVPAKEKSYMMQLQHLDHRFRVVKVDGQTIWKDDVGKSTTGRVLEVDLTPHVTAGKPFVLEVGVEDLVASSEKLARDLMTFPPHKAFRPKAEEFPMESFWGDFQIVTGGFRLKPKGIESWIPPHLKVPEPCQLETWEDGPIALDGALPEGFPWSLPVVAGIPFPEGKFVADQVLLEAQAAAYPVRKIALWPDGSMKWGVVTMPLHQADRPWTVARRTVPEPLKGRWKVEPRPGGFLLSGESTEVGLGRSPEKTLEFSVEKTGFPGVKGFAFFADGPDGSLPVQWGEWKEMEVFEDQVTLESLGTMGEGDSRYGTVRLRVTAFRGVSALRLMVRILNESPRETSYLKRYGWKWRVDPARPVETARGAFLASSTEGDRHLAGVLRYAPRIKPNEVKAEEGEVTIALLAETPAETFQFGSHPGEAKTHEFWLTFGEGSAGRPQLEQLTRVVEAPPILNVARQIRTSGVWGRLPHLTEKSTPRTYREVINTEAEAYFSRTREGIRAFGNYEGFASSFYWNSLHTMYLLYAMTGDAKWFERAERSARHEMDLLICHWSPDPLNVGGHYAYFSTKTPTGDRAFQPDFSNADFNIRSQNPHGCFNHWQLTGSAEGFQLGKGMADFVLASPLMREHASSQSARHQGWALVALSRAYYETGDERYRKECERLIRVGREFTDPRRGSYIQRHSSMNHHGIVPFMSGILTTGLREMVQQTGSPEGLKLLYAVTTAIEMETRDDSAIDQGMVDYFYSSNPYHRFEKTSHLLLGVTASQAFLACALNDSELARTAAMGMNTFLSRPRKMTAQVMYDLGAAVYWLQCADERGLLQDFSLEL